MLLLLAVSVAVLQSFHIHGLVRRQLPSPPRVALADGRGLQHLERYSACYIAFVAALGTSRLAIKMLHPTAPGPPIWKRPLKLTHGLRMAVLVIAVGLLLKAVLEMARWCGAHRNRPPQRGPGRCGAAGIRSAR